MSVPSLEITAHVHSQGDVKVTGYQQFVGTKGLSKKLEGFSITAPSGLDLKYMAFIDGAETKWVRSGHFVGFRGQTRVEGFAVRLKGSSADQYDVKYYAHLSGSGDTPVVANGEFVGTRGQGRSVEGFAVWLEPKHSRSYPPTGAPIAGYAPNPGYPSPPPSNYPPYGQNPPPAGYPPAGYPPNSNYPPPSLSKNPSPYPPGYPPSAYPPPPAGNYPPGYPPSSYPQPGGAYPSAPPPGAYPPPPSSLYPSIPPGAYPPPAGAYGAPPIPYGAPPYSGPVPSGPAPEVKYTVGYSGNAVQKTSNVFAGFSGCAIEYLQISASAPGFDIEYMGHIQQHGDTHWHRGGEQLGRPNGGRLEGFAVRLNGPAAAAYTIVYSGQIQNAGTFTGRDGEFIGTRGQSKSLEGIIVWIEKRS